MSADEALGLAGKVALITGGGAGIGRAVAELFASVGMNVAIAEIDPDRLRVAAAALPDALAIEADVREEGDVDRVMAAIRDRFGHLDVLVNNVGDFLGIHKRFEDTTPDDWESLYRINLHHIFLVTRAALPLIRASGAGGSIVNLSTIEAFRGIPNFAVYAAFKTAITGFTKSLAVEIGRDGIRVNAIGPETTDTEQVVADSRVPPENRDHLRHWFPIGRFGRPNDSAGAALFLASDRLSGWVSGSTILVDGGALAAGAWMRMPDGQRFTHLPIIAADGYTPRPGT
ncbi:SDR family oxidoreductase [Sphingomonas sp. So64.6b]|uniref:SDR family NAD(P)-dependent oxidoreductase n=1 Tax=Sphingomonas sp. So64.6b TaxID=2997354 RepID=UPI00160449A8|nr:SDR family oxidoreductase [Sphingomonas sp. So64.6b]QNA86602.1 SDR family oxidoreductase [Sphingomonas sp. So64.6b]